jgi:hypothetical protein
MPCIYTRFALFSLIPVTSFYTKSLYSCGSVWNRPDMHGAVQQSNKLRVGGHQLQEKRAYEPHPTVR